ncbi:MAG: recombination mediator RecR [Bacilli bacterium]
METIDSVKRLKESFKKLPGVGEKTAERMAYATLNFSDEEIEKFIASLKNVEDKVHVCPHCGIYIDTDYCPICDDETRDSDTLLVVTEAKSVISFEKTGKYHGKYFVLGGSLSPIKGIDPKKIRIPELKQCIVEDKIKEVILACNSTMEGEMTSSYIKKYLEGTGAKVTRLAFGLPVGADLEYVDELTIERSLDARTIYKGE